VTPEIKGFLLVTSAKVITVFTAIFVGVMMVVWAERRLSGWIQLRLGPNRVGPQGLLQLPADGIKSFVKEELFPAEADSRHFCYSLSSHSPLRCRFRSTSLCRGSDDSYMRESRR
jgi:NADH:ubiquinone oxidoreductase subunit H